MWSLSTKLSLKSSLAYILVKFIYVISIVIYLYHGKRQCSNTKTKNKWSTLPPHHNTAQHHIDNESTTVASCSDTPHSKRPHSDKAPIPILTNWIYSLHWADMNCPHSKRSSSLGVKCAIRWARQLLTLLVFICGLPEFLIFQLVWNSSSSSSPHAAFLSSKVYSCIRCVHVQFDQDIQTATQQCSHNQLSHPKIC